MNAKYKKNVKLIRFGLLSHIEPKRKIYYHSWDLDVKPFTQNPSAQNLEL
jgi:hypothetical protein